MHPFSPPRKYSFSAIMSIAINTSAQKTMNIKFIAHLYLHFKDFRSSSVGIYFLLKWYSYWIKYTSRVIINHWIMRFNRPKDKLTMDQTFQASSYGFAISFTIVINIIGCVSKNKSMNWGIVFSTHVGLLNKLEYFLHVQYS